MIKIACLLFLFVVVYYIFKEHSSAFTSLFWKSASSFCFLLVGFCAFAACVDRRYGEWMLIGLVSGAIGDVLLALPFCYPKRKNLFFLGGLLFFLFGHLAYLAPVYNRGRRIIVLLVTDHCNHPCRDGSGRSVCGKFPPNSVRYALWPTPYPVCGCRSSLWRTWPGCLFVRKGNGRSDRTSRCKRRGRA